MDVHEKTDHIPGICTGLKFKGGSTSLGEFWVQLYGLPIPQITETMARKFGGIIGEVIRVVKLAQTETLKGYMRVRVRMEILQPSKPRYPLKRRKLNPLWVEFRYERLPIFCYKGGRIEHDRMFYSTGRNILNEQKGGEDDEDVEQDRRTLLTKDYNPRQHDTWLRAEFHRNSTRRANIQMLFEDAHGGHTMSDTPAIVSRNPPDRNYSGSPATSQRGGGYS
uniref:Zinc knuckle CX2CX4HX4C domain-containing protein n=1 Tax=Nelumbo nucifera TaxID=4432 RepID=A0A822Z5U8_NELNU|nr:TPA_asm: hypothetical protein HUJ06_013081 [Nelumbo nucifera]